MNCKRFAILVAFTLALPLATSGPAALAASTGSTSSTQGSGEHGEAFEKFKAALEQLDLSATQKKEIKSIVAAAREKLQALKGQTADKGQRREIIRQARQDIIAKLTEEQKKKLREILQSDKSESKT